jgi:hypothetical protein
MRGLLIVAAKTPLLRDNAYCLYLSGRIPVGTSAFSGRDDELAMPMPSAAIAKRK